MLPATLMMLLPWVLGTILFVALLVWWFRLRSKRRWLFATDSLLEACGQHAREFPPIELFSW